MRNRIPNDEIRAELRERAYRMRLKEMPYAEIAKQLGYSRPTIQKLCQEYIDQLTVPLAEDMRKAETDKLNMAEAVAWKILEDNHVAFQHGKVVMMKDPETGAERALTDVEPVFKAIDRIVKTSESRRRLLGLDMPTKSEHVVSTTSVVDDSILKLIEELEENDRRNAERPE